MSEKEIRLDRKARARLKVVQRVERKELRQKKAAQLLGVGARQVRQILKRYRQEGPAGLASQRYGRAPGNKIPDETRRAIMTLVRERYQDCKPTAASRILAEKHGCRVSKETLRKWMIEEGLWRARSQGAKRRTRPGSNGNST